MNIRITRTFTKIIFEEAVFFMETIFYTYQEFYTHTKGVAYLLMFAALIGFIFFWRFLTGKDDEKKEI